RVRLSRSTGTPALYNGPDCPDVLRREQAHADLVPPVLRFLLRRVVGLHQRRLGALADGDDLARWNALLDQLLDDLRRPLLRQLLVLCRLAGGVGLPAHFE